MDLADRYVDVTLEPDLSGVTLMKDTAPIPCTAVYDPMAACITVTPEKGSFLADGTYTVTVPETVGLDHSFTRGFTISNMHGIIKDITGDGDTTAKFEIAMPNTGEAVTPMIVLAKYNDSFLEDVMLIEDAVFGDANAMYVREVDRGGCFG